MEKYEEELFEKVVASLRPKTQGDKLKDHVLSIAERLLADLKEDIQTGLDDGLYEKKGNVRRLKWIEKAEKAVTAFREFSPSIHIYVEGGIIQNASAEASMCVRVFDIDDYKNATSEDRAIFIENFGHPADWDVMIKERIAKKELKPVYI